MPEDRGRDITDNLLIIDDEYFFAPPVVIIEFVSGFSMGFDIGLKSRELKDKEGSAVSQIPKFNSPPVALHDAIDGCHTHPPAGFLG